MIKPTNRNPGIDLKKLKNALDFWKQKYIIN